MGVDVVLLATIPDNLRIPLEEQLAVSVEFATIIGDGGFYIRTDEVTGELMGEHALSFKEDKDGHQVVSVNTWMRYYGEGYERGRWPIIRSMIEWLWFRFPGCEIQYGGDNSDEYEVVTPESVAEINAHFLANGTRPYQMYFGEFGNHPTCPACRVAVINVGGGGATEFWRCLSCGQRFLTKQDEFVVLKPGKQFHQIKNEEKTLAS